MKNSIKIIFYTLLIIIVGYLFLTSITISLGSMLLFPLIWFLLGFWKAVLISIVGLIIFITLIFLFALIEKKS